MGWTTLCSNICKSKIFFLSSKNFREAFRPPTAPYYLSTGFISVSNSQGVQPTTYLHLVLMLRNSKTQKLCRLNSSM